VVASGQNVRETELFQQSLRLGLISNRSETPPPIPDGAETREAVFHIGGMWCTSCGWLIEHALERIRGVRSAEVMFASDLLKVRYCPQYLPPHRILERVDSLGYRAAEYSGPSGNAMPAASAFFMWGAERAERFFRSCLCSRLRVRILQAGHKGTGPTDDLDKISVFSVSSASSVRDSAGDDVESQFAAPYFLRFSSVSLCLCGDLVLVFYPASGPSRTPWSQLR
jgi:copper chaperone CopZ